MKALPLSESCYLLQPDSTIFLVTPEGTQSERIITSVKKLNKYLILSFDGITDPETAAAFRGSTIQVKSEELPVLKNGEYYHDQIIGLSVFTLEGELIGTVTDIFETRSNDIYVVQKNDREYLIPAIRDIIREVDLKRNRIVIEAINGLLD